MTHSTISPFSITSSGSLYVYLEQGHHEIMLIIYIIGVFKTRLQEEGS